MPDEPDNSKIEELLKTYARKRGEQSGGKFDVHPAVRKMLQGEVSRQYPPARPETKSWLRWMLLFWPRLAFGAAAVALLSAVLWNVSQTPNPSERDVKLAKAEKEPAKRQNAPMESFGEPQPANAPVAPEAVRRKQSPVPEEGLVRGLGLESAPKTDKSQVLQERLLTENEYTAKEPKATVSGGSVSPASKAEASVRLRSRGDLADAPTAPPTPALQTAKDFDGDKLADAGKARGAGAPRDLRAGTYKKESETTLAGIADRNDASTFTAPAAPKPSGAVATTPSKPGGVFFDDGLNALGAPAPVTGRNEPTGITPGNAPASKLTLAPGQSGAGLSFGIQPPATGPLPASVSGGFQPQGLDGIGAQSWAADSFALASTDSTARFYSFGHFASVPVPQQRGLVRFVNGITQNSGRTAPTDAVEEKNKKLEDISGPAEPLSSVFDVEQTGTQIKIIDADGSIYKGTVLVSTDEKQRAETDLYKYKEANLKTDLKGVAEQAPPMTFTASGTNKSLGKIVVINATLLSSEPPAVAYDGLVEDKVALSREKKVEQLSVAETRQGLLAKRAAVTNVNATILGRRLSEVSKAQRIQGTVRVGATNEMRLDATRQSP